MPGVALKGLTKRYGEATAVDGLTLDVKPGEMVALLGPSGCGKTTTLRLVAGFLTPEAGEIWVGERCLSSPKMVVPPERRRMAMIFQSYALWPHMTVAENVSYGLRVRTGVSRAEREKRVREILRVVRLESFEQRYPGELSGGQQQRVALARALVVEPEILLLDEPLSNLDANLREEMRFEIRRLHIEFRITTLYVTHDQAEAMVTSDRIAVMNKGRIEQVGSPDEIFERPRTRFVAEFIGKTNIFPGIFRGRGMMECGGRLFPVEAAVTLQPGETAALCIRPHTLTLLPEGETGPHTFPAVVERAVYVGEAVEYLVRLEGTALTLRVVTDPRLRFAVGSRVSLTIDPSLCVVVKETA